MEVANTTGQANKFIISREVEELLELIGSVKTPTASIMIKLHFMIQLLLHHHVQLDVLSVGIGSIIVGKHVLIQKTMAATHVKIFGGITVNNKMDGDSCIPVETMMEMAGISTE